MVGFDTIRARAKVVTLPVKVVNFVQAMGTL